MRGAVVGAYQWAITIGLLLSAVINNATQFRDTHSAYRIPIAIQFIWAFILSSGMVWLPESPRWLIKRARDKDAAKSLGRLLALPADDPVVEAELDEIRANLEMEKALGESSYLDCFKSSKNKIGLIVLLSIKSNLTPRSAANSHWYLHSGMAAADWNQVCSFSYPPIAF